MQITEAHVLFRPDSPELRFLPEGPCFLRDSHMSWVAIQHGPFATCGSINLLNTQDLTHTSHTLPGRPGFAFPTSREGVFVAGLERSVGFYDTASGQWTPFLTGVDAATTNTIINDGLIYDGNLIFGCKELEFKTRKAGLYLWRRRDQQLLQLRNDQICSNGKAVYVGEDGQLRLIDIDSPSKTVTSSILDIDQGTVSDPAIIVDLTAEDVFPDGMILTPDHQSLIVALYDPGDPQAGAARQYNLSTGELQAVWTCPGSPRVTCPQLIAQNGKILLVLTTAVEHMPPDQQQRHPAAGSLFIAETPFQSVGDQPVFEIF